MKISAEFQNEICRLLITPSDDWEQTLLGAIAKGKDTLIATVIYRPKGHITYGKCEAIQIQLESK